MIVSGSTGPRKKRSLTMSRNRDNLERPISKRGVLSLLPKMPLGFVLNSCSCAYIDNLLAHDSVHRGKPHSFMIQRLVVICGRSTPAVSNHAANIILSAFNFCKIDAPAKKFLEEEAALNLFHTILAYATVTQTVRSVMEIRGAHRLTAALCDLISAYTKSMDTMEASKTLTYLCKKLASLYDPLVVLPFITKLAKSRRLRHYLQPLFIGHCEYTAETWGVSPESAEIYNHIARSNFTSQTLIEIIIQYLEKEVNEVVISRNTDPLKLVQYLVACTNPNNSEIVQALAFMLYANTKLLTGTPSRSIDMDVNSAETVTTARLADTKFTQPVKDAILESGRDSLQRRLEIYGPHLLDSVEYFVEELKHAPVQRKLVTNCSIGNALLFINQCNYDLAIDKEINDEPFWSGTNFILGVTQYIEERKRITENDTESYDWYPDINWVDVLKEFDSPRLFVSRQTFVLFAEIFPLMFQDPQNFPTSFFHTPWKNWERQVHLYDFMMDHADVWNFSIYPHTKVLTQDLNLKAIPDDTPPIVQLWNCQEFCNILLTLLNVQTQASHKDLFKIGYSQTGDVCILSLILSKTPWTPNRQDLIREFLPDWIPKSPNVVPILNMAWNDTAKYMRQHITWSLTTLYNNDSGHLAKILDVAHDVKPNGLSDLLNQSSKYLPFIVDLACLASKRDYLNLEKWIEDKEKAHGDALTSTALQYINKKYTKQQISAAVVPKPHGTSNGSSDPLPILIKFVRRRAKKTQRQQNPLIFQVTPPVMKENSGRSSSVSSGGHQSVQQASGSHQQYSTGTGLPPSGAVSQQQSQQPPALQQQISQQSLSSSAPQQQQQMLNQQQVPGPIQRPAQFAPQQMFQPQAPTQQHPHMMNQPPPNQSQNAQQGMNLLMNMNQFAASSNRDLLKVVQPAPPPSSSMSPSTQMMRSLIPPLTQRQNSNPSWHPTPAPSQQRPSGPPTPQQQMDYRGQIPEFVPQGSHQLQRSGSVSGRSGASGAQKAGSSGFSVGAPIAGSAAAVAAAAGLQQGGGMEDFSSMTFAEDIQEEANSYFEKIYSGNNAMSVDTLIDLLKKFKSGNDRRERHVLACVVKNLFEEYRFFHEYPERELRTTAAVYGGIIREDIITNVQFATAVRKVIESLSADPNTMLWTFGIVALQYCRSKLCAYPKVCTMIVNSENFARFPQTLKDYIIAGVKGELPPEGGRHTPVGTNSSSASSTPIPATAPTNWGAVARASASDPKMGVPANRTGNVLSYTNVDTLVLATNKDGAEIAQPAEAVVDKISFLFNNLSTTNLAQKKDEVLEMIGEHGEGFTRWLAQYIVMKRVSIEQNFQPLYNQFVTAIDDAYLDQCIKRETFRNIRILLRTDKKTTVASNYSDRQLLKNLGSWLGAITIARNKPILLNDLDLKSLLLEAYYKGQAELLFVVPFISKILTACSKTALFTPTCAWIRSILKVLAELHNEPDLKINLKFEIEVLCKELNVDLNLLPMDGILKDTEKLVRVPQQLCEVKVLGRPEAASPVQSQIRLSGSAEQLSGMSPAIPDQAKPATPQPMEADLQGGGGAGSQTEPQVVPNVTHFAYHDINVLTYDGLVPHVKIVPNLPLFQLHPHAKHLVRPAMIHAIKELIGPVTERALKIAMTVTESLVRKDFALDPEEQNLKTASFHMMRAMTAGMAMITCRDPLASTMHANLAQAFSSSLRSSNGTPELKQMIEEASSTITQDNVELSTNFIVKTACEKATQEIEKRLEDDYQKRTRAKNDGTLYRDEAAAAIHAQLPKSIATQPGSTDPHLMSIYTQFSSRICGFKANSGEDLLGSEPNNANPVQTQSKDMDIICQQLQIIIKEVDQTTQAQPHLNNPAFQTVCWIRDWMQQITVSKDANKLMALVSRCTEHLLHAYRLEGQPPKNMLDVEWARRLRDLFIGLMRLLQAYYPLVDLSRRITSAIMQIRSDYKWNLEGIEILFKQNLLQSSLWDQYLADSMDNGGNMEAVCFAQKFVRNIGGGDMNRLQFLKERFPMTCDQLTKLHQLQTATRTDGLNNGINSSAHHHPGLQHQQQQQPPVTLPMDAAPMPQASAEAMAQRGYDDQEMTAKVEVIMREWIGLCYTPTGQRSPQESLAQMIQLMHEHGVLATDDKITQFFRLCVENCVDISVRVMKSEQIANGLPTNLIRHRCYYTLDAFVKLMALMIRHSDNGQSQNKINLLKKLLNIIVGVLHMDHEVRKADFNAMPYHRILISLFNEITGPDPLKLLEPIAWSILEAFGQTFFALQPRRMPGFAFAWLDIVGHRNVIGRLLANTGIAETVDSVKTAATYTQLIISHLKFLAPFLRNIQLPKSIAILYKGTLRVLLVILHDFPELLCEFHYVICDTIPPNCVQLRNLILSAFPHEMRLPDPFALNFKQVDTIPEMAVEPKSNLNMATIIPENIRVPLDEYLANRTPVDFLPKLPTLLQTPNQAGTKYNTTVMNALVLYVGIRAIEHLHLRRQRISTLNIAHTSFMDIFQNLAIQLDTEGRYLLFNGIANQLRYPNAHTHYFSCVFLYLFKNSTNDTIQEQITRILFERLVALRPHPWGLLITFIELIKNPTYNFWRYEFTSCAPEIQRLFQNVANTCVPAQGSQFSQNQEGASMLGSDATGMSQHPSSN